MKVVIKYLRIVLPHLGILLILLSMILGYFYNWRGKAVLLTTDKTNVFITKNKEIKIVPYALSLSNFNATYYESGEPKNFEATITVEEDNVTKSVSLRVNQPCKMACGQDLYLTGYDRKSENPEHCVVELVFEPFQKMFLAGLILLMTGLILCSFTRG
jgi:cytochrome c biogenesis protein ResB